MDQTRMAIDSVVFFFHGLGFFVLGLATAFQYRARREFPLTKAIWALAGFGVFQALHEWSLVFAPLQEAILPSSGALLFRIGEGLLSAVSWALLWKFGILLLPPPERSRAVLGHVPLFALLVWVVLLARLERLLGLYPEPVEAALAHFVRLDHLARRLLGLPGALVTAWALLSQATAYRATRLARLVAPLRMAAASFLTYALLLGFVAYRPGAGPLFLPTMKALSTWWALPVQIIMLAAVVSMTIATVKVLAVFNREEERRLEEAETQRAILNERLRISRDLHDGVMQSIYAVGLALENVLFLLTEDRSRARRELERSMARLNETIQDIRGYILNLRPARRSAGDLYTSVLEVVAQFRSGVAVRTTVELESLRRVSLPEQQIEEVCQIVREALTNVARHARATEVTVTARVERGEMEATVWDDGLGFHVGSARREGRQGLENMRERAEGMGGSLEVRSRHGRGTVVVLRLPLGGGTVGESEHSPRVG
jgi:signal transduction histidine kinase